MDVLLISAQTGAGLAMVGAAHGMTKYLCGITLVIVAGELPCLFAASRVDLGRRAKRRPDSHLLEQAAVLLRRGTGEGARDEQRAPLALIARASPDGASKSRTNSIPHGTSRRSDFTSDPGARYELESPSAPGMSQLGRGPLHQRRGFEGRRETGGSSASDSWPRPSSTRFFGPRRSSDSALGRCRASSDSGGASSSRPSPGSQRASLKRNGADAGLAAGRLGNAARSAAGSPRNQDSSSSTTMRLTTRNRPSPSGRDRVDSPALATPRNWRRERGQSPLQNEAVVVIAIHQDENPDVLALLHADPVGTKARFQLLQQLRLATRNRPSPSGRDSEVDNLPAHRHGHQFRQQMA